MTKRYVYLIPAGTTVLVFPRTGRSYPRRLEQDYRSPWAALADPTTLEFREGDCRMVVQSKFVFRRLES